MALFDPQTTRTRLANPANTGAADVFQPTGAPTFGDDTTPSPTFQPPRVTKVVGSDPSAVTYPGQPPINPDFDPSKAIFHTHNESDNPAVDPPSQPEPPPTVPGGYPAGGGTTDRRGAVAQFYRTALGREGSPQEIDAWANGGLDLAAIQRAIYASDEALAYSKRQTNGATTPTPGGSSADPFARPNLNLADPGQLDQFIRAGLKAAYGVDPTNEQVQYWKQFDLAKDPDFWWKRLLGMDAGPNDAAKYGPYAGGKNGSGGGKGVFDDPATKEWEAALRAIVARLNQPYDNPDLNPLLDYLRQYATKLQGPAYTPQQMDTLQTQALDPLTSQRDAMRQQILQRASQRGLDPSSGIVQDEINQLDRALSQTRSQRQGQFAANAVDLDRQNQQMSGQVLAQIAALQEQNFSGNENRALQALQLLSQIPQYADKRLQLALQSMGGQQTNPASLLSVLSSFQRQGMDQQTQDSQFWAQIGQALMKLFSHG
jgi:hypothetical protein